MSNKLVTQAIVIGNKETGEYVFQLHIAGGTIEEYRSIGKHLYPVVKQVILDTYRARGIGEPGHVIDNPHFKLD